MLKFFVVTLLVSVATSYHLDTYDLRNLIKRRLQPNSLVGLFKIFSKQI